MAFGADTEIDDFRFGRGIGIDVGTSGRLDFGFLESGSRAGVSVGVEEETGDSIAGAGGSWETTVGFVAEE